MSDFRDNHLSSGFLITPGASLPKIASSARLSRSVVESEGGGGALIGLKVGDGSDSRITVSEASSIALALWEEVICLHSSTQSGAPQVLMSFLTIFPERQTGQLLIGIFPPG